VRLHDLRHTYASFGAGGGLGLPVIGRLLGHTQASTTARYAHLHNDPLRRASEAIDELLRRWKAIEKRRCCRFGANRTDTRGCADIAPVKR
jgi:hypothetical protein